MSRFHDDNLLSRGRAYESQISMLAILKKKKVLWSQKDGVFPQFYSEMDLIWRRLVTFKASSTELRGFPHGGCMEAGFMRSGGFRYGSSRP